MWSLPAARAGRPERTAHLAEAVRARMCLGVCRDRLLRDAASDHPAAGQWRIAPQKRSQATSPIQLRIWHLPMLESPRRQSTRLPY